MTKIYTRTGDQGKTSLFTGTRLPKSHPFIEAIGTVDEANSAIGCCIAFCPLEDKFQEVITQLETIQHALFDVGAALATPRTSRDQDKITKTRFDHEAITLLEGWIDEMDNKLPQLKHFILPGGHPAGASIHLTRCIIRRAERHALPLYEQEEISAEVLIYLNRLSDYLFVLARFVNQLMGVTETEWQPHKITHPSMEK